MTAASATRADPITLEIIQSSLQAISDEMFSGMRKAAMSSIIYEVLDMGTCVTDAEGNLATSGAGIPAFVGCLDKAVKRIIELNGGPGEFRSGDVFVTKTSPGRISSAWFSSTIRRTALSSTPTNEGMPAPDEARLPTPSVTPVPMSSTS